MANLSVTIAKTAYPNNKAIALLFYIRSVRDYINHEMIRKELDELYSPVYKIALNNMNSAKRLIMYFSENENEETIKKTFLNKYENIKSTINVIRTTNNEEMDHIIIEFKVELKKLHDKLKD